MAVGQGKKIPDETRAAIIASLLEGQALTKVAADYKVSIATVSRLKDTISAEELQKVVRKKEIDIANHIARMLDASFQAITNVLAVTKNAKWLDQQSASELATFLGVTSDKVFRVLQAIEDANRGTEENTEL